MFDVHRNIIRFIWDGWTGVLVPLLRYLLQLLTGYHQDSRILGGREPPGANDLGTAQYTKLQSLLFQLFTSTVTRTVSTGTTAEKNNSSKKTIRLPLSESSALPPCLSSS